ncbi:YbbR-like domain-containing protein [uncultured Clostridium sp.]|uniref:CdaR family protein n=1 Tax=uncultured Clostridium sp. TaxID=59620 RepID=UPI0025D63C21|nr:CdaR family protein [uncultured Clostridium sp.]
MDKIKNKNKTLIPKIICLLLSFGLWIYISNVENPVRSVEVKNIPVELVNLDSLAGSDFAVSGNQKYTVDLKIEGPSADVIKAKPEDFKIVADMSTYALKTGENTVPVQIISYPENITIKNNGFLGIKVELEELVSRDISIQSKVKLKYKDNIYEMSKKITPTSVTVQGAKSSIEKISSAVISGEENGISADFEKSYDIKFVDSKGEEVKNISSNIDTAKLSVSVSNGKSVPINLKTIGDLKSGLELMGYELSSNYVNIAGSSDALEGIQSIDTENIDISKLDDTSELDVKLVLPEGVRVTSGQEYVKVKVILKVKENIDENSSKNLSIPVKYNNLKEDLVLESSTEKVSVTISGTQSELDKINESSLNAVVDLSSLTDEGTHSYNPEVSFSSPTSATITNTEKVEVVVKKKSE